MVRPLSKELQKVAIEELHEDPKIVEEDIKNIQEWIKQQPHLNAPTDKQWILGFLRGCKFSYEKTKNKLDMFYRARSLIPEFTKPRNVLSTEIQTLLNIGLILPLPYPKDYTGPRIILFDFKTNYHDTNIIMPENIGALLYMIMNILMVEDDNFMISGQIFWNDMTYYPLRFLFHLSPTFFKNFFICIQSSFPVRMKGMYFTGIPSFADQVIGLIKLYLPSKLKERIFAYSESNFENIYKQIPKNHLPKEFGGENSSTKDISAYWKNKVESYSTWFAENDQYCTNEALRPERSASSDIVIGVDGSFRKLNLD